MRKRALPFRGGRDTRPPSLLSPAVRAIQSGGASLQGDICLATRGQRRAKENRPHCCGRFSLRTKSRLDGVNSARARALRALLDVELDLLSAFEAVKVKRGIERVTVEEVILRIVRGDEAEAAIGNDLLDGAGGHGDPPTFSNRNSNARSVREKAITRRPPHIAAES